MSGVGIFGAWFSQKPAPFSKIPSLVAIVVILKKKKMTCCFSCLNPRTKDIRVDIDNARCNSRYQTDSSGSFFFSTIRKLLLFLPLKFSFLFILFFFGISVHGSDTTGTESISGILGES